MFAGAPWAAKLGLSVVSPPLVSTFLWLPPLVSLNHCFPAGDIQECCSPSLLVSMSRLLTSSMNTISLSVFSLFFLRFRSMRSESQEGAWVFPTTLLVLCPPLPFLELLPVSSNKKSILPFCSRVVPPAPKCLDFLLSILSSLLKDSFSPIRLVKLLYLITCRQGTYPLSSRHPSLCLTAPVSQQERDIPGQKKWDPKKK